MTFAIVGHFTVCLLEETCYFASWCAAGRFSQCAQPWFDVVLLLGDRQALAVEAQVRGVAMKDMMSKETESGAEVIRMDLERARRVLNQLRSDLRVLQSSTLDDERLALMRLWQSAWKSIDRLEKALDILEDDDT